MTRLFRLLAERQDPNFLSAADRKAVGLMTSSQLAWRLGDVRDPAGRWTGRRNPR